MTQGRPQASGSPPVARRRAGSNPIPRGSRTPRVGHPDLAGWPRSRRPPGVRAQFAPPPVLLSSVPGPPGALLMNVLRSGSSVSPPSQSVTSRPARRSVLPCPYGDSIGKIDMQTRSHLVSTLLASELALPVAIRRRAGSNPIPRGSRTPRVGHPDLAGWPRSRRPPGVRAQFAPDLCSSLPYPVIPGALLMNVLRSGSSVSPPESVRRTSGGQLRRSVLPCPYGDSIGKIDILSRRHARFGVSTVPITDWYIVLS